jgi:DNA-binding NarL/FixJ family response regulator
MLVAEPGFLLVEEGDDEADVTVVDIEGGAGSGDWPRRPAVVLADSPSAFAATLPAGGMPMACILKEATSNELAAAVRAVAAGLIALEPAVAALWQRPSFTPAAGSSGSPALTPRELEVLRLVASGQPNKSIALQLGISEHTVKFHIGTVLGKLNAASRAEAVALAVRAGLLPL